MTDETLRSFARDTPFVPFVVTLTTGERYEVDHPENILFARRETAIAVHGGQHLVTMANIHIVSVQRLDGVEPEAADTDD